MSEQEDRLPLIEPDDSLPMLEPEESLRVTEPEESLPVTERGGGLSVKWYYAIGAGVLLTVVLLVLFWPGLAENIESRFFAWIRTNAT